MSRWLPTSCSKETCFAEGSIPAAAASALLPTFTTGAFAATCGSKSHRVNVAAGSSPFQECDPVTVQTVSRASVSSGITRPSCWTGSRFRDSTGPGSSARADVASGRSANATRSERVIVGSDIPPAETFASNASSSRFCETRVRRTRIIPRTSVV